MSTQVTEAALTVDKNTKINSNSRQIQTGPNQ